MFDATFPPVLQGGNESRASKLDSKVKFAANFRNGFLQVETLTKGKKRICSRMPGSARTLNAKLGYQLYLETEFNNA